MMRIKPESALDLICDAATNRGVTGDDAIDVSGFNAATAGDRRADAIRIDDVAGVPADHVR